MYIYIYIYIYICIPPNIYNNQFSADRANVGICLDLFRAWSGLTFDNRLVRLSWFIILFKKNHLSDRRSRLQKLASYAGMILDRFG